MDSNPMVTAGEINFPFFPLVFCEPFVPLDFCESFVLVGVVSTAGTDKKKSSCLALRLASRLATKI